MKDHNHFDLGKIMDQVFEAAEQIGEQFQTKFKFEGKGFGWEDNLDFYPGLSYPPMNIYLTVDRQLVFEFAIAGFDEKSIQLEFKGDYMCFSAKVLQDHPIPDGVKFFKRRLKLKDIEDVRFYVPSDKFDHDAVSARYRNGMLRVTVPSRIENGSNGGIRVTVVRED